jgi:hypothetical protein
MYLNNKKNVTGREGPWVCKKSRLPYFLDSQLTDGAEVASRLPFTPQDHNAAGKTRSIEKSNDLIGNQTRDLPTFTTLPRVLKNHSIIIILNESFWMISLKVTYVF